MSDDLAIARMVGGFHGNDAIAGLWVLFAEICDKSSASMTFRIGSGTKRSALILGRQK
jgi:hypothetical protein